MLLVTVTVPVAGLAELAVAPGRDFLEFPDRSFPDQLSDGLEIRPGMPLVSR